MDTFAPMVYGDDWQRLRDGSGCRGIGGGVAVNAVKQERDAEDEHQSHDKETASMAQRLPTASCRG